MPLFSEDAPAALPDFLPRESDARAQGFVVLAGPYTRPLRWMARNVLNDLATDPEIAVLVVRQSRGLEIWIKPSPRQRRLTRQLESPARLNRL